ncbi:MAG: relaxase/mobilization nuclease domain-containing protein [Oscillospiraceae bacterium]|nr:relaxase/mobilization nuclease domain-containing protein [Oscillospiraceae bacterium]
MAWLRVFNESGKYHDNRSISDILRYCTRSDKTNAELCGGWAVNPENAALEMETFTKLANKDSGVRLRHFEISFAPGRHIEPKQAAKIAKECAKYYADDHQIVYAVHTDKHHVHAHFVMNALRYSDGMKYRGDKKDLYDFEAHCKTVFHRNGIKESLCLVRDTRTAAGE